MTTLVEDRDEILQLIYRYANAIDRYSVGGDLGEWLDTFTEDGSHEFAGTIRTGEELARLADQVAGLRHFMVNPEIEVEGDAASVRAVQLIYQGLALGAVNWQEAEAVRTPAGWRFSKVKVTRTAGGVVDADSLK
ncbi:nuclear transport factor 2 family protein [Streptomyces sp. NPDC090088]|uniref:nuclear transport factor 2 family protein n=1 Tax=Streptomyces sp. NPDC090088 TaxID=3365944 RepID=UPI0038169D6A